MGRVKEVGMPDWVDVALSTPSTDAGVRTAVAVNLRRARLAHGLSLRELAEATGVSKALLSQVERSVANPTVEVLVRIAAALDLTFSELTRSPMIAPEVIRRNEGPAMLDGSVVLRALFGSSERRRFELAEGVLPPHTSSSKSSHGRGSIEHAYVIDGSVTISSLDWSVELRAGDAMRFSCEQEHIYRTARRESRLLTLISFSDD